MMTALAAPAVHAQSMNTAPGTPGTPAGSATPNTDQTTPAESKPSAPAVARGAVPFNEHYFNFTAGLDISENYTTNVGGVANSHVSDVYTRVGATLGVDTERRSYSIRASYTLDSDFYYNHPGLDQITNNLNAVGKAQLIPDILKLDARAFATPIVLSRLGVLTSNGRAVPNGVADTYGYSVAPDLTFKLGDAVVSEFVVDHGGVFFTQPHGSTPVPVIPGFARPTDTFTTVLTERLSSGDFFERFHWDIVGSDAETTRAPGNLTEKSGLGTLAYAVSHTFSLLATGGYESVKTSIPLSRNLSGPVYFGGFQLDLAPGVQASFRAGQQFNSASFLGSLHYELTPTTVIVGLLTDAVTTPEAQLINNLMGLASAPNGGFVNGTDLLASGLAASLANFDPAALDSLALEQSIVRNRSGSLTFYDDMERTHFALTFEAQLRDTLSALPPGAPRNTSLYGGSIQVARDIRRNFKGHVSFSYFSDSEFGGRANIFSAEGGLDYQLSERMGLYLRGSYVSRQSSLALKALSPLTGQLDEALVSVGITRKFL